MGLSQTVTEFERKKYMTPDKNQASSQPQSNEPTYQPPRVEKSRRLADVTGQAAPVPSGAPVVR